jgi:sulfoxide reductase heme-binding subunit YedZ
MSTVAAWYAGTNKARRRAARGQVHPAVCLFRLLLPLPFLAMAPEIVAGLQGRPDAMEHLTASGADVLGNGAFIFFTMMLLVTPVITMTGWRWHVPLRRDFGLAMFAVAMLDLVLSAVATSSRFPGGFMTRVTGHSFLAVGTLATLLCIPLALTANTSAQRALGRYWKPLHRTTYVVWAAIVVHLLLLFGFHDAALHVLEVSAPLLALRLPPIKRWLTATRRAGTRRSARVAVGSVAALVLLVGMVPIVHDFIASGHGAFIQQPAD